MTIQQLLYQTAASGANFPASSFSLAAPNLNDNAPGDTATGYSLPSAPGVVAGFIDLGASGLSGVSKFSYGGQAGCGGSIILYSSTDGTTWVQQATSSINNALTGAQVTFPAVTARYWQAVMSAASGGTISLTDFRLYDTSGTLITTPPPAPTAPAAPTFGGTTTGGTSLPVSTQALTANATSEVVQVATDAAFTNQVTGSPFAVPTPGSAVSATGLTSGTTYYVRLGMVNSSGTTYGPAASVLFDTARPTFASATTSGDGLKVLVSFADASLPILPAAPTGFGVQVGGTAITISSAAAAGSVVTLTLAVAVRAGDVVTVTYTPGNVTDSAASANSLAALTAQPVANNSAIRNPTMPEIASALRGAQLALETTPGVLPGNSVYKRLTQSQLIAKPNVAAKPYTPMGMKGISVVQQGTEVTDYDLSGIMSYTELLYWLEAATNKSAAPVAVGTKAWTRTYLVDSRLAAQLPQTYNVQTGSSQSADQAAFVYMKDLQLKTTKDEASLSGSLVGFPLADGVTLVTAGTTDVKKAPVDPNTIGVYLGDDPAALTRLYGNITSDWMLGGHWNQTDYQNDTNPAYDSLVEMVPAFGVKITAAPSAQEQNLLTRLRAGQSIYVGYRSRGAIIEGAPGAIVSQYGLDIIMPAKVTKTPSRGDKDGVFAHDYEFGAADDPVYGLVKIVVTTDIATL